MNFKDLCSTLAREGGVAGGAPISTVASPRGEVARLVSWIRSANADIHAEYSDWKFLWRSYSFDTEAGEPNYTLPDDWQYPDSDKVRVNGMACAQVIQYELWDGIEDSATDQPYMLILMPDQTLKLYPTPDKAYTITLPYYRTPQQLAVDSDVPLIPEQFHDVIWLRALMKYAFYEAAGEVLERVQAEYPVRMRALESHQLPNRDRYQMAQDPDPIVVRPE